LSTLTAPCSTPATGSTASSGRFRTEKSKQTNARPTVAKLTQPKPAEVSPRMHARTQCTRVRAGAPHCSAYLAEDALAFGGRAGEETQDLTRQVQQCSSQQIIRIATADRIGSTAEVSDGLRAYSAIWWYSPRLEIRAEHTRTMPCRSSTPPPLNPRCRLPKRRRTRKSR
jgi:hypothetical protein